MCVVRVCICVYLGSFFAAAVVCVANEALKILPLVHWFIRKVRKRRGVENRQSRRLGFPKGTNVESHKNNYSVVTRKKPLEGLCP